MTRLPTVAYQPGVPALMTCPLPITVVNGMLLYHEESKTFPVRQITPVYWTAMSWPFFTTAPVPLIRVLTCRVFGAVVLVDSHRRAGRAARRRRGHRGQGAGGGACLLARARSRSGTWTPCQRRTPACWWRRCPPASCPSSRTRPRAGSPRAPGCRASARRVPSQGREQRPDEYRRCPLGVGGAEKLGGLARPVVRDVVADQAVRRGQLPCRVPWMTVLV